MLFLTSIVPGDVRDQVLDQREGLHGLDGDRLHREAAWFRRVMHISFGMPLISAEHEPHLPALQFQRTARSLACSAWIWWTASRTTMPSEISVV